MTDLRDALRRTKSKPLRAALESAQVKQRELRRVGDAAFRSWQGPWQRDLRYRAGDVVSHDGSSWRCLLEHTDSEPPSPVWEYVARKGDTGPAGARGFQGQQGIPGPPGPAGGDVSFEDEGVALGTASTVNFVGDGVTAAVAAGTATVTIPGGGGSGTFWGIAKWGYP